MQNQQPGQTFIYHQKRIKNKIIPLLTGADHINQSFRIHDAL